MHSEKRRRFNGSEKVAIIKQHFLESKKVSDLCDQYGIHPTMFYRWQKEFFDNGSTAFEKESARKEKLFQRKIASLEEKLSRKNEVLSELMEEHVILKKKFGGI